MRVVDKKMKKNSHSVFRKKIIVYLPSLKKERSGVEKSDCFYYNTLYYNVLKYGLKNV